MFRKFAVMMVIVATALAAVGYSTRGAEAAAPVAHAGGPYTGVAGVPVQFNGLASAGTGLSFHWNFGDNTTDVGPTPAHVYAAPGTYYATLTVTDSTLAVSQSVAVVYIGGSAVPSAPNCYWSFAGWVCSAVPAAVNCAGALYWSGNAFCAGYYYTGQVVIANTTVAQMCAWYQWYFMANYQACRWYLP